MMKPVASVALTLTLQKWCICHDYVEGLESGVVAGIVAGVLTLGAHARGLLLVCLSVYPSVPALAASASVETSKQRYSRVSLRLFLD